MAFGAYIHIPYCLQRCTYCDFATYEFRKILPPEEYVPVVLKELEQRKSLHPPQPLDTLYFGGGTPSLIDPQLIVNIIKGLAKNGFPLRPKAEVTIEINPATVSEDRLKVYLDAGINRFSVGAQTFDDALLKSVHREHNAKQTLETLEMLDRHSLNFSFDILFALPGQTIKGLRRDLDIVASLGASHISPYCLTVPSGHPLSKGRPPEEEQVEMFELIRTTLVDRGFYQYEISNFAKPGFESQHNLLYWTDQPWMALGLSAHGYAPQLGPWGTRYWNLSNINEYVSQINSHSEEASKALPESQQETLERHQALTDYCHTAMRIQKGLSGSALKSKFGFDIWRPVEKRMQGLAERGLVQLIDDSWRLTQQGVVLSNLVFEDLCFFEKDLGHPSAH